MNVETADNSNNITPEKPIKPIIPQNEGCEDRNERAETEQRGSGSGKINKIHTAIQIVSGTVIGMGVGYLLFFVLIPGHITPARFVFMLFFIITALFINLNLYKLGRFVTGRICGGQIITYQFTCLRFYKSNGALRMRLTPSRSFTGHISVIPPREICHAGKYIGFYSGGAAFCLAAGCLFIIAAILTGAVSQNMFTPEPVYFLMFLRTNAIVAFISAAVRLIPVFWGDTPSDGIILLALMTKNPETARLLTLSALTAQLSAGIRPSDLDIPDIRPVFTVKKKRVPKHRLSAVISFVRKTSISVFRVFISAIKKLPSVFQGLTDSLKTLLGRIIAGTRRLRAFALKLLYTDFFKPKPRADNSILGQAIANTAAASRAVRIAEMVCTRPEKNNGERKTTKIKTMRGINFIAVIKERRKTRTAPETAPFPSPEENEDNLSDVALLLRLYFYYIALDSGDQNDILTHLMVMEKNISRIPRQIA
ncbi:MAG: hypothetical protein PHZ09_13270, partial [Eubacteriales bacterium]|nr:hypothetical protein [Eubacteriales bacterium]